MAELAERVLTFMMPGLGLSKARLSRCKRRPESLWQWNVYLCMGAAADWHRLTTKSSCIMSLRSYSSPEYVLPLISS